MVRTASPKMPPPQPPGPPDGPPQPPDPNSTPRGAEQGQRRYVYKRRTPPTTTRRTKIKLIDRQGQRVPGDAEAEEQNRKP